MRLEIRKTNNRIPDFASPMPVKRKDPAKDSSSATIGFEANLWLAADKLRAKLKTDCRAPSHTNHHKTNDFRH